MIRLEAVIRSRGSKRPGATPNPIDSEAHNTAIHGTDARRITGHDGSEQYCNGHTTRKCMRVNGYGGIILVYSPSPIHILYGEQVVGQIKTSGEVLVQGSVTSPANAIIDGPTTCSPYRLWHSRIPHWKWTYIVCFLTTNRYPCFRGGCGPFIYNVSWFNYRWRLRHRVWDDGKPVTKKQARRMSRRAKAHNEHRATGLQGRTFQGPNNDIYCNTLRKGRR